MTYDISASRTGSQEKEKTACTDNGSINELFQTTSNDFKKTKKAKKDCVSRKREHIKTTESNTCRSNGTDTSRKTYQTPVSNSNKEPFDSRCISGPSLLVKGSEMFKPSKSDIRKRKGEPVETLTREHKDIECSTDISQVSKSDRKRKRDPNDRLTCEHKDVECSTDSSQVFKSSKSDIRKRKRESVDNLTNQCEDSTNIVQKAIHPLGGMQIHVQEDSEIETRFENISSDKFMTNDYRPIKRFKK